MRLIDADELKKKSYPFPCAIGVEHAVTIRAINEAPTVDAVAVGELQAAIDKAESTRDSIVGGSQFAPYMYAYLCLRERIEGLCGAKMKRGDGD